MKILASHFDYDFSNIRNKANLVVSKRYYKDINEVFECYNMDDNPLLYEVYQYSEGQKVNDLNWGLTILKNVMIGNECNMSKGHWHAQADCSEIYFTIKGSGYLLLMDDNGNTWAEEMVEKSLHYIPGNIAHRIVNIGNDDLHIGACWPSNAGHDYKRVSEKPFGYKIKKIQGQIVAEKVRE